MPTSRWCVKYDDRSCSLSCESSLPLDDADCELLRAADVRFSKRDGRARLSFHLYSDEQDLGRVLDALG